MSQLLSYNCVVMNFKSVKQFLLNFNLHSNEIQFPENGRTRYMMVIDKNSGNSVADSGNCN